MRLSGGEPGGEARNPVEGAADAGLDAFALAISEAGGEVQASILLGLVEGLDPPGVIAGGNLEPDEIFDVLVLHLKAVGDSLGYNVQIVNAGQN